jgi:hypothetical protein
MKKLVNQYSLDRILSRMAKEYGKIKKGNEDLYSFLLMPMESNILKLYRKNNHLTGHHVTEAICIVLLKIDGYVNSIEYDFSKVITEEARVLANALLLSFDPFTRAEIFDLAEKIYDLNTAEGLKKYFEPPVKCLLRIEQSVNLWSKEWGRHGYFDFIEQQIGSVIEDDGKMLFSIEFKDQKYYPE